MHANAQYLGMASVKSDAVSMAVELSKSQAYLSLRFFDDQQPYRMQVECLYPVDGTPGPRL